MSTLYRQPCLRNYGGGPQILLRRLLRVRIIQLSLERPTTNTHSLSTYVPFNPSAKRPAGYAFVNLSTANEAQRAINNLSGKALLGRKVLVQPARNSEKRGGSRQSSIHPATEPDVMPELSSRLTQRMEMW